MRLLMHCKKYISVPVSKKLFSQQRNCSVNQTASVIVSSVKFPKYLTLGCCLIYISPYFFAKFFNISFLNLEGKSINCVLSSPKWPTNQSHISEISSKNVFQFHEYIYVDKQDMDQRHRERYDIWLSLRCHWPLLKTSLTLKKTLGYAAGCEYKLINASEQVFFSGLS